jgi:recombination protein RecA
MLLSCSVLEGHLMATAEDLALLLARLDSSQRVRLVGGESPIPEAPPALVLAWPGLEEVLPDGGLPRGIVELTAPRALGGATSLALAAVRSGQSRAHTAWCAWLDPEGTLHAPGVEAAGIDRRRLLMVRPPRAQIARIALKVVSSGAFEVVVVDFDAVPGANESVAPARGERPGRPSSKAWAPEVLVRKLALAAEPSGTTVLLLTDSTRPRAMPWPVALRLELSRPCREAMVVRVGKDRRGRIGVNKTVPFHPVARAAG